MYNKGTDCCFRSVPLKIHKGAILMKITSDITVIGGGIAGICAAVSAARNGASVSLVQDRPMLGGNNSSECRVHMSSAASSGNPSFYLRETGVADELKLKIFHYNPRYESKSDFDLTDMVFLQFVKDEENIKLFLSTAAYDVEVKNGLIKTVKAYNSRTEEYYEFESPYFIDASGDGVVSFKAGAECRQGREAKSEYGESLAPEQADSHTMGSCLMYTVAKDEHPVPFVKPPFAYDFVKEGLFDKLNDPSTGRNFPLTIENVHSVWWMSYGGMGDTIKDEDKIHLELKKLVYGFWDYVKNSGKYKGSENYYINWMAPFPSKRESRRVMGEYVLNQNDIQKHPDFKDQVATAGWPIDVHDVGGIYGHDMTTTWTALDTVYGLPLRMMYSKNIDNLMLAGRIVSATHIAMGSFRVMQTLGAMGQAIGTAAAVCAKKEIMPKKLAHSDTLIKELQEILQHDGQFLVGRKESVGKAENARVYASSFSVPENVWCEKTVCLDKKYFQVLPLDSDCFESVKIFAENDSAFDAELCYTLYESELASAYNPDRVLAKGKYTVKAKSRGFIKLSLPVSGFKNNRVLLGFEENDRVKLGVSSKRVTGAPALIKTYSEIAHDEIKQFRDCVINSNGGKTLVDYCFVFKELKNCDNVYNPVNIINGYSRPYIGTNIWVTDEKNPSLSLEFSEPQNIKELILVHNAQLETDHFSEPIECLNKDFDVVFVTENGEKTIQIRDNFLGQTVIKEKTDDVKKITVNFISNYGKGQTELYAIKVF